MPIPEKCRRTTRDNGSELVAEGLEGLCRLAVHLGVLLGIRQLSLRQLLALVVCCTLGLAALLQSLDDILVLPANFVAQSADSAVLSARLQSQNTEGLRNDHLLHLVVGGRNTLEDLESLHGSSTSGSLVGDHASDRLVEDSGGGTEVERTTSGGVVSGHLSQVGMVLELRSEELARDVEGLAADDDDLLATEQLLGDDGCKTTQKVALAIDDDNRLKG